jgi:hypothetical protein
MYLGQFSKFGKLNVDTLIIVAIFVIIVGVLCSTQIRNKIEEGFENVVYPNNSVLKYKKLNETCSSEDFDENTPISTLTSEDAEFENCLGVCNDDNNCQSIIFNNKSEPTCELYSEKCYNMVSAKDYNPNKDCPDNGSCSYNKDNVIPNKLPRIPETAGNRFLRTRQFCSLDDEDLGDLITQGDNDEEETEVPTIQTCVEKCASDPECNSIHTKNYGNVDNKNMKCRLYTGKCLKPADFYNNNCNEELCSYNKYPCGQYECREYKSGGISRFKLFCNNFLFDSTTYNDDASCQAKIDLENEKPDNEKKICPANCTNEAKLYDDIMLEVNPNNFLLNSITLT